MSFFKNLLGGLVKDVVENVVENVLDSEDNIEPVKGQTTTVKPVEQKVELVTTELVSQDMDGSQECHNTTFDADGDKEYRVEQYYAISPDFWEFDSGAAEIDVAYAYDPNAKKQEESKGWEVGEPYIGIMFDNMAYEMIQQYKKSGTVKTGRKNVRINIT